MMKLYTNTGGAVKPAKTRVFFCAPEGQCGDFFLDIPGGSLYK